MRVLGLWAVIELSAYTWGVLAYWFIVAFMVLVVCYDVRDLLEEEER